MDFGRIIGLICPGGGLKCCAQAGDLCAIDEFGIKINVAQGISAGAFNLAGYFIENARWLREKWLEVEKAGCQSIFNKIKAVAHLGGSALFSNRGLQNLLLNFDFEKFVNHPALLEVVLWNEGLEQLEIVSNQQFRVRPREEWIQLRDVIEASACLTGCFSPKIINRQLYSDGCEWRLNSFSDCDTIFVLQSDQLYVREDINKLKNRWWAFRLIKRFNSIIDSATYEKLDAFAEKYEFRFFPDPGPKDDARFIRIARHHSGKSYKKLIVWIQPTINISTLRLDSCSRGDISASIKHNYQYTQEILEKLDKIKS